MAGKGTLVAQTMRMFGFVKTGVIAATSLALMVLVASAGHSEPRSDCFGPDRGRRIEACTELLKNPLRPRSKALAFAMRALSYSLLGRYDEALADYDSSLAINPNFSDALNNRAWAYFKSGRAGRGVRDVERALLLAPRSAHAFDTRAHIHQALGRSSDALRDYRRAAQLGGPEIIRLYQCGLQANGLYSGTITGLDSREFQAGMETCVADKACDPLPADEECRKLTS